MNGIFDAALPPPYSGSWKQAERPSPEDSPRLVSYQAPGGEAIGFTLKGFKFSGGQSVDTAEYPFDGLWSNEALNEKPHTLQVEGFIRGAEYITTRNALIEALRVKTDDDAPGFIDFPFWGRFPIVVIEYEVAENTGEKGQCAVSMVFKRAGVSVTERETALTGVNAALTASGVNGKPAPAGTGAAQAAAGANGEAALPDVSAALETAVANLQAAAVTGFEQEPADGIGTTTVAQGTAAATGFEQEPADDIDAATFAQGAAAATGFEQEPADGMDATTVTQGAAALTGSGQEPADGMDTTTFTQGAAEIKTELLNVLGRVRAAQTLLNRISGEINGTLSLAAQTVQAPGQTARALFNAAASIVGALAEIRNSVTSYFSSPSGNAGKLAYPVPERNNEKNVLLRFLSAAAYTMEITPLTVRQEHTQKAMENLYRICAFAAASLILPQMDIAYTKARGYWNLFRRLEESIDKEDPAIHVTLEEARICVSRLLSAKALSAEKKRYFNTPLPLLYMAHYLGCDEAKLRELNRTADSFLIKGGVVYV